MTGRKKKAVCDGNLYRHLVGMSIHDSLVSQGKMLTQKQKEHWNGCD